MLDHKNITRIHLFQGLSAHEIPPIIQAARHYHVTEGEVVISPDHPNEGLHILLEGQLSVQLSRETQSWIRHIIPGESCGEISLIQKTYPTAYVVATQSSTLLEIPENILWAIIEKHAFIARNLLRTVTKWLVHNTQDLAQHKAQSQTDALTGLYNRRWLDEMLPRMVGRHQASQQSLCVVMLDVDHFKKFNDRYGHAAGDVVLTALGQTLIHHTRPSDAALRYGGEEFTVLMPETSPDEALQVAERLRLSVEQLNLHFEHTSLPTVTISMGLAQLQSGQTGEQLLQVADQRLYTAKEQGRNRINMG
ncbi:GGDEF domain-containing protein [Magnetococcus sp. PR-3]|uniref:GGDEF domain-containing protein n=1 Tax=Magnetococcus sp. PR-3 TaxID=3120355 RepID=UPI002FCE1AA7